MEWQFYRQAWEVDKALNQNKDIKREAVERARRVEYCQDL
jgi:hypothetical protein